MTTRALDRNLASRGLTNYTLADLPAVQNVSRSLWPELTNSPTCWVRPLAVSRRSWAWGVRKVVLGEVRCSKGACVHACKKNLEPRAGVSAALHTAGCMPVLLPAKIRTQ